MPFLFGDKNAGRKAASAANEFTQQGIDALMPFLDAGRGQLGSLTSGATAGGLGERLSEILGGDFFKTLVGERERSMQGQLSAGGLTRSGTAMESMANIPTELALALENMLTGRSQSLAGNALSAGGGIAGMFGKQGENVSSGMLGDAQTKASFGGAIGGVLSKIFFGSDERLKINVVKVSQLGVLPVYEWDWIPEVYGTPLEHGPRTGFMAADVEREFPQHIGVWRGWKVVNYVAVMGELQKNLDAKIAREALEENAMRTFH